MTQPVTLRVAVECVVGGRGGAVQLPWQQIESVGGSTLMTEGDFEKEEGK